MKQINRVVIVIFMTFLQFSCFSKRTGNMKEISKKHKKEKIQITDADLGKKNNFTHTEIKNEMDKKYEEIDIYEFLNKNKDVSFDVIRHNMKGKSFILYESGESIVYFATSVSKEEPGKDRERIGVLSIFSMDATNYYIWFEKYDKERELFVCDDVQLLIKKDNNVLIREIRAKDCENESILGLYFYDKNIHLKAEAYYAPQYIIVINYNTASFTIQDNADYQIINDL